MNYIQMLKEIEKQLETKYTHVTLIYEQTKELRNQLSYNDKVTSNLQLKWRGEEIEKCVRCDERIQNLLYNYGIREQDEVIYFLRGLGKEPRRIRELIKSVSKNEELETTEAELLVEELFNNISVRLFRIRKILESTVENDSEISKRLIGKDSFYNRLQNTKK